MPKRLGSTKVRAQAIDIALRPDFPYIAITSRHWKLCRARGRKPPGLQPLCIDGDPMADIAAITKLMVAAGISTEGARPKIIDSYQKTPDPPKPSESGK